MRAAVPQPRVAPRSTPRPPPTKRCSKFAAPVVHVLANVLLAEGYPFTVFTPSGGLRLASTSHPRFIDFALDTSQAEPFVLLRVSQTRGRRVLQHERAVKGRTPIEHLTEEDVLQALLEELAPFVER